MSVLTTSRSFICLRSLVRQLVSTTLAYTVQELELVQPPEKITATLTVRGHDDKDDDSKSPLEVNAKEYQCNRNIDKSWNDVEQDQLESVVDSGSTIEDTKDFPGLAVRVERERQVQQVVERKEGHF